MSSAGTRAAIGRPFHREAALVATELGGDPSLFSARQLTRRIASEADLVITMTKAHRDDVLELAPHRLHQTFTVSEIATIISRYRPENLADLAVYRPQLSPLEIVDVPDPIGRSPDFFVSVGRQIAALVPPIVKFCSQLGASR